MADSPPNDLETGIGIWAPKFVPVVFFLLLLALAGSGTLLGADAVRFARERMEQRANALFAAWKQRSASHMAHILQSIAADERYRRPFLTRDGDSLRTRLQPLFDLLERSHHYTQLALYDTNGGPVWHRHSPPPGEGARIPATLLEAHRRNQTATGLQTDHRGVLSLSVVVPWQGAGERIGYLELIREIDPVRDRLEMAPGFHLYPFIDKNRLRRPLWEKRLARSKQPARWDEWSDLAATTSGPRGDGEEIRTLLSKPWENRFDRLDSLFTDGRPFRFPLPLRDAAGQRIGLIIFEAVDGPSTAPFRWPALLGLGACAVGIVLLVIAFRHPRAPPDGHPDRVHVAALQAAANTIVITDEHGRIQWVNPSFTATTGYSLEEVMGKNPRVLKSGTQDQAFYDELWQTILSGRVWRGVFINRRKNGALYHDEATITPVFDRSGRITHFVAVKQDVTDRIRTEEEMNAAKQRAEAASRAKNDFLAVMSHEIRTPMNGILGMTDLMLDLKLSQSAQSYVKNIKRSGESLLAIINDILDFTKIEAGKLQIERVTFDLRGLIRELSELFTESATRKNIAFRSVLHTDTPQRVSGDPTRLRQVLVNLLANAIKFTEKGEVSLIIAAAVEKKGHLHIPFQVRDSGIGIPPQHLSRLFTAFEQADTSTTRKYGGTGLGLAITHRLVTLMNGEIKVMSTPGRGTLFQVIIPFAPATELMPESENDGIADQKTVLLDPNTRLLVVEDDAINRAVIKGLLKRHHLRADYAENGHVALEKLRNNPYELVLMDCQMPEMDGFDVTKRFRQLEKSRTGKPTPIIALTACVMQGDRERCLAAGMNDHIGKPIRDGELIAALMQWLPGEKT